MTVPDVDVYAQHPPSWWKRRNAAIARAVARGVPHADLAARYGISRARIGQIAERAGVGRKHLDAEQRATMLVRLAAQLADSTVRSWRGASVALGMSPNWAYHFLRANDPALLERGLKFFASRRARLAAEAKHRARARILAELRAWRRAHRGESHPSTQAMLSAKKNGLPTALAWSNIVAHFGSLDGLLRAAARDTTPTR